MEWSKVKNIIILILLLVNGFLLVLVAAREGESRRYRDSALTQAVEVLERSGIQVDRAGLADVDGLEPLQVDRDVEREGQLAAALLGEAVDGVDQGGGVYSYAGSLGRVEIRSGGALSAQLEDDPAWRAQDPAALARELLERMGVEAVPEGQSLEQGSGTVSFRQSWQGAALFSGRVEFTFEQGRLTGVEGVLLIQSPGREEAAGGQPLTLPTALLRFLDGILASGDVCSAVEGMEPGYLASQSFSGSVQLSPAWKITTNMAVYYLNALTGELTRAE